MNSDRRPGTRLPDDTAYWENLAARSVDAAFGGATRGSGVLDSVVSGSAHSHRAAEPAAWWRGMSDAAFVLAASAVLALLGASMLLDERSPRPTMNGQAFTQVHLLTEPRLLSAVLAPDEPMLATLLDASAGSPAASVLLKLVALREEER